MSNTKSIEVIRDFLTEKRSLDSEVYEAIRTLYLSATTEKAA